MVALLKSPSVLRLTQPDEVEHDDRRMFQRKSSCQNIWAKRMDHTVRARLQPTLQLNLRDVSAGGLSATSPSAFITGEHVAVTFPHEGPHPAWDAFGRVVRCLPCGQGYTVALAFDPLPAA